MDLIRCENGHFYDASRFNFCPHCDQSGGVETVLHDEAGDPMYTMPLTEAQPSGLADLVQEVKEEDAQATIGYFGDVEKQPVVGWLVAISGNHSGEDFKLKTGRNFIGRANNMDVALTGDSSVSRDKHAVILYEPKNNMYLVQPGDSKELAYLNDGVILSAMEIKAYDVLAVGETKMLFVPLCTDKFNWDSVKETKEEEK